MYSLKHIKLYNITHILYDIISYILVMLLSLFHKRNLPFKSAVTEMQMRNSRILRLMKPVFM
jgi:hypothetical protein